MSCKVEHCSSMGDSGAGGMSVSAADVAEALARQIAAGAAALRDAAGCRLAARAEAGHLNFLSQGSCAAEAPQTPVHAPSGLADHQQLPHSHAERAPNKSGRAQMMPATSPSPRPLDALQHQSSQQPWSIPARHTGQAGCMASSTGCSAEADAGACIHVAGRHYSAQAKQRHLPADKDSGAEWARMQGLQSQQPGPTRAQHRSAPVGVRAQAGAERGHSAAAEL